MVYSISPPIDHSVNNVFSEGKTDKFESDHLRGVAYRVEPFIRQSSRILDIGCATGNLMRRLEARGYQSIYGIDPSPQSIGTALSRGLNASCLKVSQLGQSYDLAILCHVLEHIPDPGQMLSSIRKLIPTGILYIEVPDRSRYHLFSGLAQAFNLEHINHFRMKDLVELCDRSGLEVVASGNADSNYYRGIYPSIWVAARPYSDTMPDVIASLEHKIADLPKLPPQIAIWGLGQLMQIIFGLNPETTVTAATDSNPIFHGQNLIGVTVVPPTEFRPAPKIPILICSDLKQAEILASIRNLGLHNPVITVNC